MKKAFIIHGSYGNPQENWYPWLKNELEKKQYSVIIPKFPTPTEQSFSNWKKIFIKYSNFIDNTTKMIAHSVGVPFILRLMESNLYKFENIFLISGFINKIGIKNFDSLNKTFINKKFQWNLINKFSPRSYIYHSDNDPYVDIKHGILISKKLFGSRITIIKNAGHFNEQSGYKKFPQLLADITNS